MKSGRVEGEGEENGKRRKRERKWEREREGERKRETEMGIGGRVGWRGENRREGGEPVGSERAGGRGG